MRSSNKPQDGGEVFKAAAQQGLRVLEKHLREVLEPHVQARYPDGVPPDFYNDAGDKLELSALLRFLEQLQTKEGGWPFRNRQLGRNARRVREGRNNVSHSGGDTRSEAEQFLNDVGLVLRGIERGAAADEVTEIRDAMVDEARGRSKGEENARSEQAGAAMTGGSASSGGLREVQPPPPSQPLRAELILQIQHEGPVARAHPSAHELPRNAPSVPREELVAAADVARRLRTVYGLDEVDLARIPNDVARRMPERLSALAGSVAEAARRAGREEGSVDELAAFRELTREALEILGSLQRLEREEPLLFSFQSARDGSYLRLDDGCLGASPPPLGRDHRWLLRQAGHGSVIIGSRRSEKVLDVYREGRTWKVHPYAYHGGDNQHWSLVPVPGGAYVIRSVGCGRVLDAYESDHGAAVHLWEEHGDDNQRWWLHAVP